MEQIKCSSKDHPEVNAIIYCIECKIYMCDNCEKYHSILFDNHHKYNIDKKINEIFTGFCNEKKHCIEFNYFCKTHNELVCPACITKIKGDGFGQHSDCDICLTKYIKDKKRTKLKDNIIVLEDLSKSLGNSIIELKEIFDKINMKKEELIINVQKRFTKLRYTINEREEQLISEIEDKFNILCFKESIIKNIEELPDKVKISLDKGKLINKEWKDSELNMIINNCIDIEKNIQYINELNQNIIKLNSINNNLKIEFILEEEDMNKCLERVKQIGKLYTPIFKFKKCPPDIDENRKFTVSGEKENIFTKNGTNGHWTAGLCEYELEKSKEYRWKIKILKSQKKNIMVGVTPIDYNVNTSDWSTCGWYMNCNNSYLYSGPPYNYNGKQVNLERVKDEVIIVMNMNNRTLKFIINNEDKGESYTNIPIEKPIFPIVIMDKENDSIEIKECYPYSDNINLDKNSEEFTETFRRLEIVTMLKDKIIEFLNIMISKIKNIYDLGTVLELIDIKKISKVDEFFAQLKKKYETNIKKQLKSLNYKELNKPAKILAKFFDFIYIHEKNCDFVEKNIEKLDKKINFLIINELVRICKGDDYQKIKGFIYPKFFNELEMVDTDDIINLIHSMDQYDKKMFLEELMKKCQFTKEEYFSKNKNKKIDLLCQLNEKGLLRKIDDESKSFRNIENIMQQIWKDLEGEIIIKKLEEFLENEENIVIKRLGLIKIISRDFNPKKLYKFLKIMIEQVKSSINRLSYIKNSLLTSEKNNIIIGDYNRLIEQIKIVKDFS